MKSALILTLSGALVALVSSQTSVDARGMPAEQRDTIHGLFDAHDKFEREVTKTDDGYTSRTTSSDPAAVELIQTHVKQMESRLKDGMRVRSWDPAYVEFVNHYDDIDIQIIPIENGISIVAVGKTEAAREVARNHAGIISKFIDHGWKEHDKTHAAVFETSEATNTRMGRMGAMSCCQGKAIETAQAKPACSTDGDSCCKMETQAADEGAQRSCCRKAS